MTVSIATTNRRIWIVGMQLREESPYGRRTLAQAIALVESNTGVTFANAYFDRENLGHDYHGAAAIHIAGSSTRKLTPTKKIRRKWWNQ